MDVDDPAGEAADEARAEQLHEAREHDELGAAGLDPVAERVVARVAVGMVGDREDRRLDSGGGRPLEAPRALTARADADDLDPVAPVDGVEQRLEVAALA
jgi:hypothetical protein